MHTDSLLGDDTRPRCRQCERLGEKCHRSGGRLKFRPGSSAKYDTTFGKDQTWLSQTKICKSVTALPFSIIWLRRRPCVCIPYYNTHSLPTRSAKIQFVDQGPELENFYSHDDPDSQQNSLRNATSDSLDSSDASLQQSYTSSTVHTSLSPEKRSPVNYHQNLSGLPILSPTSTLSNSNNSRSPLKRSLPDDLLASIHRDV